MYNSGNIHRKSLPKVRNNVVFRTDQIKLVTKYIAINDTPGNNMLTYFSASGSFITDGT